MEDETLPMPSAEALMAATLASMTAWAAPCPEARLGPDELRDLLARKVVSNLFFLHRHPDISERMRGVLEQMHARWQAIASAPPLTQLPRPKTQPLTTLH